MKFNLPKGRNPETTDYGLNSGCLLVQDELSPAILLPAAFIFFAAELALFPVAHGADTALGNPGRHQRGLGGGGAGFAECQVVFRGATLIAISADHDLDGRVLREVTRRDLDRSLSVGADVEAV